MLLEPSISPIAQQAQICNFPPHVPCFYGRMRGRHVGSSITVSPKLTRKLCISGVINARWSASKSN